VGALEEALAQKALFTLLGMVGTIISGCLVYFIKTFYEDGRKRIDAAAASARSAGSDAKVDLKEFRNETRDEVRELAQQFMKFRGEVVQSYGRLKDRMHQVELTTTRTLGELKATLDVTNNISQTATREIHKLEGRVGEHMQLITSSIAAMKSVSDKVDLMAQSLSSVTHSHPQTDKPPVV
jgi:methyl-accepting chemotaxis protein